MNYNLRVHCVAECVIAGAQVSISGYLGGEWGIIRDDNACLINNYRVYYNAALNQHLLCRGDASGLMGAVASSLYPARLLGNTRGHGTFYEAG